MLRTALIYSVVTALFVAGTAYLINLGPAPISTATQPERVSLVDNLHTPVAQLLIQLIVIVVLARIVGMLFRKIGQPTVVGEMFAGIALGPSVLGTLAPKVSAFLFPPGTLVNLGLLSQVGIILFMFVVGMELDVHMLRQKAQTALLVSHTSIFLPFLLGVAASLYVFRHYATAGAAFVPFALFMGISMSVTAFPVLARILRERGLMGTELGNVAITCAAVGDATAWCALAFIVAVARAESLNNAVWTLMLTLALVLVAFAVARPILDRWARNWQVEHGAVRGPVVAAFVCAFLFALGTEAIGIHALFGAFIAGVAMPKRIDFRNYITERLETFSTLLLLPIFFAFTGLRTEVGLLSGGQDWLVCGLLLLIAVSAKLGGAAIAAALSGMPWRDSVALGALMNTRGLMELIALNLALDLGVFTPKIFAMLVLMALATTFATGPILSALGYGYRSRVAEA